MAFTIFNKDTKYQSIEFNSNRGQLTVESKDNNNTVEFELHEYGERIRITLDQEEIKELINHLQKQLI